MLQIYSTFEHSTYLELAINELEKNSFKLQWGPIYWGLIGAIGGFLLGFLIDFFIFKVIKKRKQLLRGKKGEVI